MMAKDTLRKWYQITNVRYGLSGYQMVSASLSAHLSESSGRVNGREDYEAGYERLST